MQKMWSINQFLFLVTSIAILFVIMKFSADLLAPFLISVALAVILSLLLNCFEKKHIPKTASLVFIILISFMLIIMLVIFTVSFMLMESDRLYNKLKKILLKSKIELEDGMAIIAKINAYFIIKAKTSMMSSVLILAVLLYYDIPYPYLLTALSFFFGFIPVVGDILSTVPAIILAFMEGGAATAMWIILWYVTINSIVGNIIEPRIMSKGLVRTCRLSLHDALGLGAWTDRNDTLCAFDHGDAVFLRTI